MRSVDETLRPMHDFHDRIMYSATPPARSQAAAGLDRSAPRANEHGLFRYTVPGFMMSPPSIERIALYHYITKSRQDFVDKRSRGSGTAKVRTWDEFEDVSKCAICPPSPCTVNTARPAQIARPWRGHSTLGACNRAP